MTNLISNLIYASLERVAFVADTYQDLVLKEVELVILNYVLKIK